MLLMQLTKDVVDDYKTIREELESYSPLLKEKYEILCINKIGQRI